MSIRVRAIAVSSVRTRIDSFPSLPRSLELFAIRLLYTTTTHGSCKPRAKIITNKTWKINRGSCTIIFHRAHPFPGVRYIKGARFGKTASLERVSVIPHAAEWKIAPPRTQQQQQQHERSVREQGAASRAVGARTSFLGGPPRAKHN